jgi:hypothetical protein
MSLEITVPRAPSQKRIDANRRNAVKSSGPRTPEGKNRSRFNGLKHGLTASIPVIPGEDPAAYEARLEAMIESMAPRNQVELDLLGKVAAATWSLERATRAEAAQISHRVRNEAIERERRQEDDVIALGQRLFWDARGPWQAYPHKPQSGLQTDTLTSRPQDPADANTPALQVIRLERTIAGCQWLLDRWAELRARLESGEVWTGPDLFKGIRLLGKQPLDAIDDPDVTLICLASANLLPNGDKADPFATIKSELRDCRLAGLECEYSAYSKELSKRSFATLQPSNAGAAREALRELIDRQTSRLKMILARNQQADLADAAEARDRLAFDPSAEGEKLRRYSHSTARLVNQTIRTYLSVVRCPLSVATEESGGESDGHDNCLVRGCEGDVAFAERKATVEDAAFAERKATVEDAAFEERKATIEDAPFAERKSTIEPSPTRIAMSLPSFHAEPSATNSLRTEPSADLSVVGRPRSVVAEEPEEEPERGAGDGAVRIPQGAVTTAHERPAQILRTEANAKSSVVGRPLSVVAVEKHGEPERGSGDGAVESPEGAAASAHEWPAQILRTEPNAIPGRSHSPHSIDPHSPPASSSAPGPIVAAVAAGTGPHDVRNRRFFGAQMTAARASPAGTERTSRTNQHRAGSRKPTKRRRQD